MTESFTQAVARRDPEPVVIDPRDGTVLDLAGENHELLVDVLLELRRREQQMKQWRTAVEDELVRRHGDRRAAQVVGDHEVDVERDYSRVWDYAELEGVIDYLVKQGLVKEVDTVDLFVDDPKVNGRKAAQLLSRVEGDALVELRRCFTWEQKGRAKVVVTPVASLEP